MAKKRKGNSVQDLLGAKSFTKYGLKTKKGELLFYTVSPTNISVLSYVNIEIKIRHLMMVLSSVPDKPFIPISKRNNQKYCAECAKRRHRRSAAESLARARRKC